MAQILWLSMELADRDGQGGQRRQFHQIRALSALGHEVTVLVPKSAQSAQSIKKLTTVIRPRLSVRGRWLSFLVARARTIMRDPRWDAIVVSHHESWWLLPPTDSLRAPVLLDVHNVLSYWHSGVGRAEQAQLALQQERVAVRAATAVATCSALEARRLVDSHPEAKGKTFAAPLGVDPLEWPDENYNRDDPVVALFGGWFWEPNARGLAWFMAQVWPDVRRQCPDAVVLVAGTGARDTESWPDGARFVGRVTDLAAFTASAAVVAVPVVHGVGASVKFAEALASGSAVIATPDGANGFDHSPAFVSDDSTEWARWIVERLTRRDAEPAPNLAREIALHNFTWEAAVEPIDEWIRSISG